MQDGRQARTWMMAMEMVIAEVEEVGEKVEGARSCSPSSRRGLVAKRASQAGHGRENTQGCLV